MTMTPGQIIADKRLLALPDTLAVFSYQADAPQPSAWLATALYGALLSELRLARLVVVRPDSLLQVMPLAFAPDRPRLAQALAALPAGPFAAQDAIKLLRSASPHLPQHLASVAKTMSSLLPVHRDALRAAIDAGPAIRPRFGVLLALTNALGLLPSLVERAERPAAVELAAWVADRDAVARGTLRLLAEQPPR